MPLLTQYQSFFISPFGEASASDELNKFVKSHRIINVEKQFINSDRGTGWAFIIEYGNEDRNNSQSNQSKIDYRDILTEKEFSIFDKLRQVRKEQAEKAGIPIYAVFTNEQLAEMSKLLPKTLTDLKKIKNIGESKLKQFGEHFIEVIVNISTEEKTSSDIF